MKPRSIGEKMDNQISGRLTTCLVTVLFTMGALTVVGCGKSSDPLAGEPKYKTLARNSVPPTAEEQEKFNDFALLGQIFPEPDTGGEMLVFREGEEASYSMKIRLLQAGVRYSIVTENRPAGAEFRPVVGSEDEFVLTWKPQVGATAGEDFAIKKMKINLKVESTDDETLTQLMSRINTSHEISLIVARTKDVPLITQVDLQSKVIPQGTRMAFSVTVQDLSVAPGEAPEIAVFEDIGGSQDKAVVNEVTRFVVLSRKGEKTADGQFIFKGFIDTRHIEIPAGVEHMDARFGVRSFNSQRVSPLFSEVVRIVRPAVTGEGN